MAMAAQSETPTMKAAGAGARGGHDGGACASSWPLPSQPRDASAARQTTSWPPVILLGGENNSWSVAHSLSTAGVKVYAINRKEVSALRSRHLERISVPGDNGNPENWRDFLLSAAAASFAGAAILCCSDEAIKLVAENWDALSSRYLLEPGPPQMRLDLLDKLTTYESASACGVAHPRFWRLEAGQSIGEVAQTCQFPVILKPRLSQHSRLIGAKYLRADNREELERKYKRCQELHIAVVAMEFIPGADDLNCSYYTYIDQNGKPLCHFTKRLLRRHPVNEGGASYHVTDWNPEVAEQGLRLFQHVGLRGLGNVEFKRDPRDGVLKLMEVNARFTAGNKLVTLSGIDLALLSYRQLTGRPYVAPRNYCPGLVMWDPIADFLAFRTLRSRGEITFAQWLRQAMRADTTPIYDFRDPLPGLHHLASNAELARRRFFGRVWPSPRLRAAARPVNEQFKSEAAP